MRKEIITSISQDGLDSHTSVFVFTVHDDSINLNEKIKEGLEVTYKIMSKEEALKTGAEAMFIEKYGNEVKVYYIGDYSKEICGGPHVKNTNELGHFKIKKEESSSSGVRRIKAILE